MSVNQIKVGHLSLDVRGAKLIKALEPLDRDANGIVEDKDIFLPPFVDDDVSRQRLLKKAVAAAFKQADLVGTPERQQAVEEFFNLYEKAWLFNERVEHWKSIGRGVPQPEGKTQFLLPLEECQSSDYEIPGHGDFTTEKLSAFTTNLFRVFRRLADVKPNERVGTPIGSDPKKGACALKESDREFIEGFEYDQAKVPGPLKQHLEQVAQWYLRGGQWLFSFDQTGCFDERTRLSSAREYDDVPRLIQIWPSSRNSVFTRILPACEEKFCMPW